MRLRITRARIWDAPRIARILWSFGDEVRWLPRVRSRIEERQLLRRMIARGWVVVARERGRIVGFIAAGEGEVHGLYIARERRGQGVGRALLDHAQTRHDRLGLWAHAANHPARRFYTAAGFRPVALGDGNDERLTEIRFEWARLEWERAV